MPLDSAVVVVVGAVVVVVVGAVVVVAAVVVVVTAAVVVVAASAAVDVVESSSPLDELQEAAIRTSANDAPRANRILTKTLPGLDEPSHQPYAVRCDLRGQM